MKKLAAPACAWMRGLLCVVCLFASDLHAQESAGTLAERREEARALVADAVPERFEAALALLQDSDPWTRVRVLEYLGAVQLVTEADQARRVEALLASARADTSAEVRLQGLKTLAGFSSAAAARALVELVRTLPAGEAGVAAQLLADTAYPNSSTARELLEQTVLESFLEGAQPLASDVLAALLPAYGKRLAEREGGGELPRERAPLVLSAKHPAAEVRTAAQAALVAFLGRLRELQRFDRSDRALARFAADGVPTRPLLYIRVISALEDGAASTALALAGARQLGDASGDLDDFSEVHWRARSALLEGLTLIALDQLAEAETSLARAADLYAGLLARRSDRAGRAGAARQRDLFHELSLVEFTQVFRRIAAGQRADDPELLQLLRNAHAAQLRMQLVAISEDLSVDNSLDPFFDSTLSPYRLILTANPHGAWDAARGIEVQRQMGRALASISAKEMPGFEPFADLLPHIADPVLDESRARLLERIAVEEALAIQRKIEQVRLEQVIKMDTDPALQGELAMLSFELARMQRERQEEPLEKRFFGLRQPSVSALSLSELMRQQARTAESRILATRFYEELRARELPQKYTWAVAASAQAQLAIGGSWSDDGDAKLAQEHMERGLEQLEGLRTLYKDRRRPAGVNEMEGQIAEALVSLAVNANVKGGDAASALAYFERAYELRQDDFMRILLACYRARSGQDEEARALIEEVPASPRGYYNLACTYALLGDTTEALDFLERDFDENRSSPAAREKQKAWARSDPDLASLRDDPRFQVLTTPVELPAELPEKDPTEDPTEVPK